MPEKAAYQRLSAIGRWSAAGVPAAPADIDADVPALELKRRVVSARRRLERSEAEGGTRWCWVAKMSKTGHVIALQIHRAAADFEPAGTRRFSWKSAEELAEAAPAWSGLSRIQRSMRRKFSSAADRRRCRRVPRLPAVSRSGIRANEGRIQQLARHVAERSTRRSTSSSAPISTAGSPACGNHRRDHRDEIRTRSGWSAVWHSDIVPPWQTPRRFTASTPCAFARDRCRPRGRDSRNRRAMRRVFAAG